MPQDKLSRSGRTFCRLEAVDLSWANVDARINGNSKAHDDRMSHRWCTLLPNKTRAKCDQLIDDRRPRVTMSGGRRVKTSPPEWVVVALAVIGNVRILAVEGHDREAVFEIPFATPMSSRFPFSRERERLRVWADRPSRPRRPGLRHVRGIVRAVSPGTGHKSRADVRGPRTRRLSPAFACVRPRSAQRHAALRTGDLRLSKFEALVSSFRA